MRRLPKPSRYELNRWSHASNRQRRALALDPGNPNLKRRRTKLIVCDETGETWPTIAALKKSMGKRVKVPAVLLARGMVIEGKRYRRAG